MIFMRLPSAACPILAAVLLLVACNAPTTMLLTKRQSFTAELNDIAAATGSLLVLTFYSHPMNPATGSVMVSSGSCLCIDTNRGASLVTAKHVLHPENERPLSLLGISLSYEKSTTRRFFFPADEEIFARVKTIHTLLSPRH